ncbi:MAG: hypothetical protein C0602_05510 [Denitrovibrio sp.]|nr:MAG: hypothetical protein C0602_05510 [Denitrovibrio sp.]
MINIFNRIALNFLTVILIIYFAVFTAWYAAYSNYFFFPIVYQMEDIHGHVLKYAPQNKHGKEDFAYVSSGLHLRIFSDMLKAVDNEGKGLDEITYPVKGGEKKFLTTEEVVHLQDVSDLISLLKSFWRLVFVLLSAVVLTMIFGGIWPYFLSTIFWALAAAGAFMAAVIYGFGFTKIFYKMHELVFPEGHRWHFYYQYSLMSTILKAPDSFADFGIILGLFTVIAFIIFYWILSKFVRSMLIVRDRRG